jgi:hypothetical protein
MWRALDRANARERPVSPATTTYDRRSSMRIRLFVPLLLAVASPPLIACEKPPTAIAEQPPPPKTSSSKPLEVGESSYV